MPDELQDSSSIPLYHTTRWLPTGMQEGKFEFRVTRQV